MLWWPFTHTHTPQALYKSSGKRISLGIHFKVIHLVAIHHACITRRAIQWSPIGVRSEEKGIHSHAHSELDHCSRYTCSAADRLHTGPHLSSHSRSLAKTRRKRSRLGTGYKSSFNKPLNRSPQDATPPVGEGRSKAG